MRKTSEKKSFYLSIAGFTAIWFLFFLPAFIGGEVFFSHDIKTFYYPYRHFAFSEIQHGVVPLWSPYSSAGYPVHAAAETGIFYPLNWLFFSLFNSLQAYTLVLIFHYLLAGIFVIILQRERAVPGFAAFVSACIFSFGGFMITHLIHCSIICAATWLPLILYFIHRFLNGNDGRALFGAIAVISLQFLASHPQIAVMTTFTSLIYALMVLFQRGRLRTEAYKFLLLLIIIPFAYGLSAVQLFPTAELSHFSTRGTGGGLSFIFQGSLQPQMLLSLVFPAFFGLTRPSDVLGYGYVHPHYWGQGGAFWEMCGYTGVVSLILVSMILFCPSQRKRSWPVLILAGLAILLALGKWGFFYWFFHLFPGASKLRFPSRFLLVWTLCIGLLAGDALNSLYCGFVKGSALKKVARFWFVSGIVLCLIIFITFFLITHHKHEITEIAQTYAAKIVNDGQGHRLSAERYDMKINEALRGIGKSVSPGNTETILPLLYLFGMVLLIGVTSRYTFITSKGLAIYLSITLFIELFSFSYFYNKREIRQSLVKPISASILAKDGELWRFLSPARKGIQEEELLKPCYNVLFGFSSIITPGPFLTSNLHDWLRITGAGIAPFDIFVKHKQLSEHLPLLSLMNIKYIVTSHEFHDFRVEELLSEPVYLYLNTEYLSRITFPQSVLIKPENCEVSTIQFASDSHVDYQSVLVLDSPASLSGVKSKPLQSAGHVVDLIYDNHLVTVKVSISHHCFLRLSDAYFPGWKAFVDNTERSIFLAEGLFRAVELFPGEEEVIFRYEPFSYRFGLFTSLIVLMILLSSFCLFEQSALPEKKKTF